MERSEPQQEAFFDNTEYIEWDLIEYYRADGNMVCGECDNPFKFHPLDETYSDELHLTRLCNGDLVKT